MSRSVFTLYEADAALYPSDEEDQPGAEPVFIGHCFERVDCALNYQTRLRPFLGEDFQRGYNEDQAHTIELRNALQISGAQEFKSLDRFGRHVLVVVWHDEEKRCWMKRTWYGVTVSAEQAGGDVVIEDSTTLRAEQMIASIGSVEWPDLVPDTLTGQADYVRGSIRVPLYRYAGAGLFVALETQSDGLGRIFTDGDGLKFEIEGEVALLADAAGLVVSSLVATGGSYLDTALAKIELRTARKRVATLVKDGTLAVPYVTESATAPGQPRDLDLRPSGVWSATFGEGRTTAKSFTTP